MPVKASYLIAAGGGAILLWSGVKGYAWSTTFRNLITTGKPTTGTETTAYAIQTSPAAYTSGGTVGTGTVTAPGPSGVGERAFWIAVLTGLAAPPTTANIQSLIHWRTRESPWNNQPPDGAQYTHNPLNTTLSMPGATEVNSAGVKRYPNAAIGVAATVRTLHGYSGIVSALRSGRGLCGTGLASEFTTWSGGGYSGVC